ncbi:MAG: flgF [Deltaproteobacteria bacterium]|nr:flgF [Deltaproteobacteria bacterium]
MSGVYTVVSGAIAQEKRLAVISANLANAMTAGYKAHKPVFEGVLSSSVIDVDQADNTFVGLFDAHINFAEGSLINSGSKLDVAIQGEGFFAVRTAQGTRYTRNGQFAIDRDKRLVTHDGDLVLGDNGEILLDGINVLVEQDGSVYVDKDGTLGNRVLAGKLKIVRFADNAYLQPIGRSLFANMNPEMREIPAEECTLNQGYYEASNVEVVREMIDMIACMRAYEAYSKVQQSFGDMTSKLMEIAKV